uniref:SJCHGC06908 protein n=1 Tax=Schistosoma japonicum TaxID=6182 RepID=Q5DE37_SCHJA|nr:SJCHGC06908 protein [Schistosoma japonicum]
MHNCFNQHLHTHTHTLINAAQFTSTQLEYIIDLHILKHAFTALYLSFRSLIPYNYFLFRTILHVVLSSCLFFIVAFYKIDVICTYFIILEVVHHFEASRCICKFNCINLKVL